MNNITTTNQISQILHLIQEVADGNSLIVFDVDNVLSIPSDVSIRQKWRVFEKIQEYCWEKKTELNSQDIARLSEIICLEAERGHVDEKMEEIIKYIEANDLRAVALTHCNHDKINYANIYPGRTQPNCGGGLEYAETWAEWRYECLKKIGIDFKKLSHINECYGDRELLTMAKLYNGVILTGGYDKGECLEATLKMIELKPSKIIFIDDHAWNLASVAEACSRLEAEFHGIFYTKALDLEDEYTPYDAREALQAKILMEEGRWLSDTVADEMVAH